MEDIVYKYLFFNDLNLDCNFTHISFVNFRDFFEKDCI